MSIISVENLSKQYRIGEKASYKTLRETLMNAIMSPAKLFRRNGNDEDNTIWALKDVSFEVKEGEVLGIIGRNGAGKSTLLKVLSRITEPTAGEVRLRGRVASLLEVGTGFHPELTGRENVYLNGAILGMTRAEINKKFDEIVAFAEIEKFIDTPVKRYSSGMYVRLAFAVAAYLEPEILLVDEVLAVGDAGFQKKCINKMSHVSKEGKTVLVVSHNLRVVEALANNCIYLKNGLIAGYGPVLDIVKQYQRESFNQQFEYDLPPEFDVEIHNPKMMISNLKITNDKSIEPANVFEPGQSMSLSFDLEAKENISDFVISLRLYRDNIALYGFNSNYAIGMLSLSGGQRKQIKIIFEEICLLPGYYSMVIFVKPTSVASFKESISMFYKVGVSVIGSSEYGGGYIYLKQKWSVE